MKCGKPEYAAIHLILPSGKLALPYSCCCKYAALFRSLLLIFSAVGESVLLHLGSLAPLLRKRLNIPDFCFVGLPVFKVDEHSVCSFSISCVS